MWKCCYFFNTSSFINSYVNCKLYINVDSSFCTEIWSRKVFDFALKTKNELNNSVNFIDIQKVIQLFKTHR